MGVGKEEHEAFLSWLFIFLGSVWKCKSLCRCRRTVPLSSWRRVGRNTWKSPHMSCVGNTKERVHIPNLPWNCLVDLVPAIFFEPDQPHKVILGIRKWKGQSTGVLFRVQKKQWNSEVAAVADEIYSKNPGALIPAELAPLHLRPRGNPCRPPPLRSGPKSVQVCYRKHSRFLQVTEMWRQ